MIQVYGITFVRPKVKHYIFYCISARLNKRVGMCFCTRINLLNSPFVSFRLISPCLLDWFMTSERVNILKSAKPLSQTFNQQNRQRTAGNQIMPVIDWYLWTGKSLSLNITRVYHAKEDGKPVQKGKKYGPIKFQRVPLSLFFRFASNILNRALIKNSVLLKENRKV